MTKSQFQACKFDFDSQTCKLENNELVVYTSKAKYTKVKVNVEFAENDQTVYRVYQPEVNTSLPFQLYL